MTKKAVASVGGQLLFFCIMCALWTDKRTHGLFSADRQGKTMSVLEILARTQTDITDIFCLELRIALDFLRGIYYNILENVQGVTNMRQIKDIIDKSYKEIADRLIFRKEHKEYFDDSIAPSSANLTHTVSEFDDSNYIFYRMLEDVRKSAELKITHESLFEFFGGHAFIDFDSIDTDGDIPSRLLEAVDYKRIASILYYAKHHKIYDEELEEEFFNAISETTLYCITADDLYSEGCKVEVDSATSEWINKAVDNVLENDVIEINRKLTDRYKVNKDNLLKFCTEKILSINGTNHVTFSKLKGGNYVNRLIKVINKRKFLTLEECRKIYLEEKAYIEIGESSYAKFFKNTISALAGFNYYSLKNDNVLFDRFILFTMTDQLNKYVRLRPCRNLHDGHRFSLGFCLKNAICLFVREETNINDKHASILLQQKNRQTERVSLPVTVIMVLFISALFLGFLNH